MTPKEQALSIVNNYTDKLFEEGHRISKPMMKMCATIAVEGIIEAVGMFRYGLTYYDNFETKKITTTDTKNPTNYWKEVKQEINKF